MTDPRRRPRGPNEATTAAAAVRQPYDGKFDEPASLKQWRLKVLPMFRIGREADRTRGYDAEETLAGLDPAAFDPAVLQCSGCRAVGFPLLPRSPRQSARRWT
jgi:hypothetical protein